MSRTGRSPPETPADAGFGDTTPGVGVSDSRSADGCALPLAARRALPPVDGETRNVFGRAGLLARDAPRDHALRVRDGDVTVYHVAARAQRGVAGWRQWRESDRVVTRPVETPPAKIAVDEAAVVPVGVTPAWVVAHRPRGVGATWHARVRFGERVKPVADPAPQIAAAWHRADVVNGDGDREERHDDQLGLTLVGDTGGGTATVVTVWPTE